MIKSNYPERTGKHFICYCNRQTPHTSEWSIAQAVFHHIGGILDLSQEQLSAEAHLSGASVSRFFRKCGFASFQAFKQQMERFLSQRNLKRSRALLTAYHGLSDDQLAHQLYQDAAANLQATIDCLDLPLLRQVVQLLVCSRTIYFVGDNRDMYSFYSLQLDLMCNGRAAYFYNIDEISQHSLASMDQHTLVLILSVHSFWYNEEMSILCQAARKEHAMTVLFCQGQPYPGVEPDLYYPFGQQDSMNNGYFSMLLLAQILSTLFYKTL